jgi:hypothetical protein
MKKIIYVLAILGLVFTGCNPLEDINKSADAQETPVVGNAEYTLTADNYSDLGLTYGSFNSEDEAKQLIPGFLADTYPYSFWGQGSSVLVGYNLYVGAAEGVSDYTGAESYTLANSDYPKGNLNAVGFYPNENPSSFMGAILDAQYASPVEGQIVLTKYKQYTEQPVEGISNLVNADFKGEGTLLDWTAQSVTGDQVWVGTQYGAKMSGYASGNQVNEDWLVSPEIDLTTQVNPVFQVTQVLNYGGGMDFYNIMVSTDYTDDVTTATWTDINVTPVPPGTSWTAVTSDDFDLSAYEGQKIYIAFKYESDATTAGTWEIEKALVKVPGVEGATISKDVFYTYTSGAWKPSTGVYVLSAEDYDSMGEASGQPGRYNNFDSSMAIDDYVQTFLSLTAPYAYGQDDDEVIIVYKYYSSSAGATQTRGNLYTVVNGAWQGHQSTIETSLQFGFDNGEWVPDNTIRYTLTSADYEYIGNTLASDPDYSSIVATLITYHDYDYNWTDPQIIYSLGVLLDHIDPNAAEGQKYQVSYLLYDSGIQELTAGLIKTGGVWVSQ